MPKTSLRPAMPLIGAMLLPAAGHAHDGQGDTVIHALAHLAEQQDPLAIGVLVIAAVAVAIAVIRIVTTSNRRNDQ